jgi:basic membrane protein A and related proteins
MAPYAADNARSGRGTLLAKAEESVRAGRLQPFAGEIRDQDGNVRVRAGAVLNEAETRSINWLAAGMQGRLKG